MKSRRETARADLSCELCAGQQADLAFHVLTEYSQTLGASMPAWGLCRRLRMALDSVKSQIIRLGDRDNSPVTTHDLYVDYLRPLTDAESFRYTSSDNT